MHVMIISGIIIFLSLVSGLLMLWRIPQAPPDSESRVNEPSGLPEATVSIIIPARNEALRLPPLLTSLLIQDIRPHEIIVVDDQSTDDTARLAEEAGVIVIRSEQLDGSWIGKSRACWSGARKATGDWLLFLDADTRMDSPHSLRRLLNAFKAAGGRGSLSLQPYHTVIRLYENLSAIFNIITMAGMNVFTPLGERLRSAGLFGPCLICRREDYFTVGGHETIRRSVMDDLALGDSFRQGGYPVHCYGGRGLISFRMYPEGPGQLIEGWSKNFCSAAKTTHPFVFSLILLWICGGFSIMTVITSAFLAHSSIWISFGLAAYLVYALMMVWLARRTGSFNRSLLMLFPVLLLFFALLFSWSIYLTKVRHAVSWRGRRIKV